MNDSCLWKNESSYNNIILIFNIIIFIIAKNDMFVKNEIFIFKT